jgi:hypothetical protein
MFPKFVPGFLMIWLAAGAEPILFLWKTSFHELLKSGRSIMGDTSVDVPGHHVH